MKCKFCEYEWSEKKKNPKSCPRCKKRFDRRNVTLSCNTCGEPFQRIVYDSVKKPCFCSVECSRIHHKDSISNTGHPNWKGGKTKIWEEIRQQVLKRDEFKCRKCGEDKKSLSIHHIDKNKENNDIDNLITFCGTCHRKMENHDIYNVSNNKIN